MSSALMRLAAVGNALRGHPWWGDVTGVLAFAAALLLRMALDDVLPQGFPFLTFFPAVILTTFLCGLRPGTVCAILCGLASWYFLVAPEWSSVLGGPGLLTLAFHVFIVPVDIALIHLMRRASRKLVEERAVTAALCEQQRTMFQELQHRVANNMQFASALLMLQKRQVGCDPEAARTALDEAAQRLETMARIHRRLYDPALVTMKVGPYFQDLCTDLLSASGRRNVVCRVAVPAVTSDLTTLTTLSLVVVVVVVVTNALKHAFAGAEGGTIAIGLEALTAGRYTLAIADDGRGMPADFDPARSPSLGFRIVHRLAAQLDGRIVCSGGSGTVVRRDFSAG